jgi:hypothetical protein
MEGMINLIENGLINVLSGDFPQATVCFWQLKFKSSYFLSRTFYPISEKDLQHYINCKEILGVLLFEHRYKVFLL